MRSGTRRFPARLLAAATVTVLVATTAAVALPVVAPQASSGHLVREVLPLSGAGAPARAAAVDEPGRSVAKAAPRTVGAAWSADVDVPDGTQMVDLTWAGSPDGAAQIRFRDPATDEWSDWTDVASEPDEAPDAGGNGRYGAEPLWLGHDGTTGVQVKVAKGDLTDLRLGASHWVPPTGGGATAGAEPAGPKLHGRNEWAPGGWRSDIAGCGSGPYVMPQLRFAVVHHTVNANTYGSGDVPGMMAAMYRYHTDGRGWCDIAYQVVIDRFGRVWQGRSGDLKSNVMGGHAKGFNTDSVGIALLGQYDPGSSPAVARPTSAEISALESTLAWKLAINGINPRGWVTVTSNGSTKYAEGTRVTLPTISGHLDSSLTGCPGDYVYDLLPQIRANVASRIAGAATPRTWAPLATGQSFFRQLSSDAILTSTVTSAAVRTSLVARSGRSRASVSTDLIMSSATEQRMGFLVRLYYGFTGARPSSTAYFRTWVQRRDAGWRHEQIANAFAAKYADVDDEAYVRMAYRNVLGTSNPNPANVATWVSRLRSGWSRGRVMLEFTANPVFRVRVTPDQHLTQAYFTLLRRLPDAAGRSQWFTFWANGATTTDTIYALLGSPEYAARF
jgi:hypothetical protein